MVLAGRASFQNCETRVTYRGKVFSKADFEPPEVHTCLCSQFSPHTQHVVGGGNCHPLVFEAAALLSITAP
eukprot:6473211-Amphidinium_carterae.1